MAEGDSAAFNVGMLVVKRGDRSRHGVIASPPRRIQGELWYPVRFTPTVVENVRADDLEEYRGQEDLRSLLEGRRFATNVAFARRLTMSKLRQPLRETIYSMQASRTEYHPHQFRPLLKFLTSERQRLLIADEVGLGKTIEAGFILQEQKARHAIDRILIVCPASLRTKWQQELWNRFREQFEVLNAAAFRAKVLNADADRTPRRLQAIVSLQTLRSASVVESLELRPPSFDLVIVDEAHHCRNSETSQHHSVRAVTAESDAVVFLTATPLHLGNENLFNLLRLLLPEEFDRLDVFEQRLEANRHIVAAETHLRRLNPQGMRLARESLGRLATTPEGRRLCQTSLYRETCVELENADPHDRTKVIELQDALSRLNLLSHVMTRARKREVYAKAAARQANVVYVDMTTDEREIYDRVSDFCFQRYTVAGDDFAARFALITLQRQLASSVYAALDYYNELIQGEVSALADDVMELSEDDIDDLPDDHASHDARTRLIDDPGFVELIRSCRVPTNNRIDTKLEKLCSVLRNTGKVVVFSYFKRSLRYLERELTRRGIGCVRIDGDVPTDPQNPADDERLRRIAQFRDRPETQVLLSSEVGSEGLDFQFCSTLVNWDLPWNPMVVEQRIGRLDRLGQRSERILIFNFSSPGTIEDRILTRLYTRVGLFEGAIGVLEPILGQQIRELTERLFDANLTAEERDRMVEEAALALERRVREERQLEEVSANLIGQDEFFARHLERTRRLGRYVTPDETRVFVADFLDAQYPESRLMELPPMTGEDARFIGRRWRLPVSLGLRQFLQAALTPDNDPMLRFLEKCAARETTVTFDGEYAIGNPGLELLHAQHPMVRAIAEFYGSNPDRIHAASAVQVVSDAVPPGDYFFLWARVHETGLEKGASLWAESLSIDGAVHPDPEQTELLLHHMIIRGQPFDDFCAPPAEFIMALYEGCEGAIYTRVAVRRVEATNRNVARVEARLASLQASYEYRRAEIQRRLDTARASGSQQAVAFEGQLRKCEATYLQKRAGIDGVREISVTPEDPDGAGFVRVLAP